MLQYKDNVSLIISIRHYLHDAVMHVAEAANAIRHAEDILNESISIDTPTRINFDTSLTRIETAQNCLKSWLNRASVEYRATSMSSFKQLLQHASQNVDKAYIICLRECRNVSAKVATDESKLFAPDACEQVIELMRQQHVRLTSTSDADEFVDRSTLKRAERLQGLLEVNTLHEFSQHIAGVDWNTREVDNFVIDQTMLYVERRLASQAEAAREDGVKPESQNYEYVLQESLEQAQEDARVDQIARLGAVVYNALQPNEEFERVVHVVIPRVAADVTSRVKLDNSKLLEQFDRQLDEYHISL